MSQLSILKQKAHWLNTFIYGSYLAYLDAKVRWYVRVLLAMAIGYAVSPLDLVPDLTPVFGFLDDVVMVTSGIYASYNLVPKEVRRQAQLQAYEEMSYSVVALKVVGYTWMLLLTFLALVSYKFLLLDIPFNML
ncbi:MAG: DUF1232 domain-containing protein [Pontibacter sp.]|nr:DUF1232 domain-containing protein [Pontibacter sp.]